MAGSRLSIDVASIDSSEMVRVTVTVNGIQVPGAFAYDENTLNSGKIVIDDVAGDVTISVNYETISVGNPVDNGGFPWWIIIAATITGFILLLIYIRRRDEEEEESA